jgi:hypothetical protein
LAGVTVRVKFYFLNVFNIDKLSDDEKSTFGQQFQAHFETFEFALQRIVSSLHDEALEVIGYDIKATERLEELLSKARVFRSAIQYLHDDFQHCGCNKKLRGIINSDCLAELNDCIAILKPMVGEEQLDFTELPMTHVWYSN